MMRGLRRFIASGRGRAKRLAGRLGLLPGDGRSAAPAAPAPAESLNALSLSQQRRLIQRSGLFDARYYRARYGADAAVRGDPLGHYLRSGAAEGKNPNEFFDADWYVREHRDIAVWRANPLLHYILHGSREGRATGPGFDAGFYRFFHQDVAAAGVEPLRHYLVNGRAEGRTATRTAVEGDGDHHFRVSEFVELNDLRPGGSSFAQSLPDGDPVKVQALEASAASMRSGDRPVILHLIHPWGGGAEKHIADIALQLSARSRHIVLEVRRVGSSLRLDLMLEDAGVWRCFGFTADTLGDSAVLLSRFGLDRVHVHYALDVMDDVAAFLSAIGLPYDISIHDYGLICPRVNLVRDGGRYCGEPDEAECARCLARPPLAPSTNISAWRAQGRGALKRAERVICPSLDAAARIQRYVPEARIIVAPHEPAEYRPQSGMEFRHPARAERLRVAVLGLCAEHKGGAFLLDCVEQGVQRRAPIDWTVIGWFPGELGDRARNVSRVLRTTGPYDNDSLAGLITAADPHLIFFPQHCPETYSFTLSEAFAARRPILAPDLGAFPERVAGVANCRVYSISAPPADVLRIIEQTARDASTPPSAIASSQAIDLTFYDESYLRPVTRRIA